MRTTNVRTAVVAALSGATIVASGVAGAQGALEEIIVSATRREVNLQDAPLAIVALTDEMLTMNNVENMEDLTAIVPNVLVRGGPGGPNAATFNIRGIPRVGTYIDGIWQVTNAGLLQREFVELERVEVLRGPQGTLYGRDSTGGSIHLYTQRPAEEFGATVDLGVGSYDRQDIRASVDVPFGENFRSRWTVGSYDHDGFVTSKTTGTKTGFLEDDVIRGDVLWTPSERIDVRLSHQEDELVTKTPWVQTWIDFSVAYNLGYQVGIAEATDIASGGLFNPQYASSGFAGGQLGEFENRSRDVTPNRQDLKQTTFSVDVDVTDNISFKYLYGDTEVDNQVYTDWSGSEFNFFVNYDVTKTELDSHEIQFSGGSDRFTWVGGAYYWDQWQRQRGVEWRMSEWIGPGGGVFVPGFDPGVPQTLDYADVLAAPVCSRTPASYGLDFTGGFNVGLGRPITAADRTTEAGWPFPCDWAGGFGWIGALAFGGGADRLNENTQDGTALFGEVTIGLTERLDLTLGYRQHDQTVTSNAVNLTAGIAAGVTEPRPVQLDSEFNSVDAAVAGPIIPETDPRISPLDFDKDTMRAALQYDFTDTFMAYVSYNEGFNAGGASRFEDTAGPGVSTYQGEDITNTEIGIRSDLLDGRLRLNATYFQTDWDNIQLNLEVIDRVTGQPQTEVAIQNVGAGEAEGFEVEANFAATDNVLLGANLGFLDTAYLDIPANSPGALNPIPVTLDTPFAGAPEETYNLSFQHTASLAGGSRLVTRVNANYWGAYVRSEVPAFRQQAYVSGRTDEAGDLWVFNARLAYQPAAGNYELALWGNNLTDEYNINSGFMHGIWQFDFGAVDRPREVGITMRMFFQ